MKYIIEEVAELVSSPVLFTKLKNMREKILKIANELGVISETDLHKLNDAEKVVIIAMEHAHRKGHNEGFNKGIDQASQLIHKINIERK